MPDEELKAIINELTQEGYNAAEFAFNTLAFTEFDGKEPTQKRIENATLQFSNGGEIEIFARSAFIEGWRWWIEKNKIYADS